MVMIDRRAAACRIWRRCAARFAPIAARLPVVAVNLPSPAALDNSVLSDTAPAWDRSSP